MNDRSAERAAFFLGCCRLTFGRRCRLSGDAGGDIRFDGGGIGLGGGGIGLGGRRFCVQAIVLGPSLGRSCGALLIPGDASGDQRQYGHGGDSDKRPADSAGRALFRGELGGLLFDRRCQELAFHIVEVLVVGRRPGSAVSRRAPR